MKAQKATPTEIDPVLAALDAAPSVPLTEEEARALALAEGDAPEAWRSHADVLKALAAKKE
jgi:hypothetical protein